MIERWQVQRIELRYWRRTNGWRWRDVLCRLGLHWPRRWERPADGDRGGRMELLCQNCRYRLETRPLFRWSVLTAAVAELLREGNEMEVPDGSPDSAG